MDSTINTGWFEAKELQGVRWLVPFIYPLLHQATRPKDQDLLDKVGLSSGEDVLFFAGYHGDWPYALSRAGCNVTYIDLSDGLVELVRRNGRGRNFVEIFAADGGQHPNMAAAYDWSMSFEPLPMRDTDSLHRALERSLLNRKGGKIVVRPKTEGLIIPIVESFAAEKGAEYRLDRINISAKRKYGLSVESIPHTVLTVETNDELRREAYFRYCP